MLTTGYDVKRLKKMYLLRGPHAQSLLQTISRVNRPYKSPNGKIYKYGYIVDFVDIEEEYDRTIEAYIKELEADLNENGENEGSLSGLVVDKEDIYKRYKGYKKNLEDMIDTSNLERFSRQVTNFTKEALLKIRRLLNGIRECKTEFILSRAMDYANKIDSEELKKQIRLVQERIDFINLHNNPVKMMDVMNNDDVVEIIYQFIKTKITIMDLGQLSEDNPKIQRFTKLVTSVQNEIKNNKNKNDIKVVKLDELLKEIFNKLSISDLSNIDDLSDELEEILQEMMNINKENDRLSKSYGGNYAFVKTYQDMTDLYSDVDKDKIEKSLIIVYENIKGVLDKNILVVQGRKNFIDSIKHKVTKTLLKEKLYSTVKSFYDKMLNELYTNLQLF